MASDLIVIDDSVNFADVTADGMCRGYVPRDMSMYPVGTFAPPAKIDLIPREQWPDLVADKARNKSRLSDIRMIGGPGGSYIPSLDQNDPKYMNTRSPRWGYCWCYATVMGCMLIRARMNQPYVRLSAFGLAYTTMGGKDQGAWGALSLENAQKYGIPTEADWPNFEQRSNPTFSGPAWENAKKYRPTDAFVELADPVYDRDLNADQVGTCLLRNNPCIADKNDWGHCICYMDLVDVNPRLPVTDNARWGVDFINSWGDEYSQLGVGRLAGRKWLPDNCVAITGVMAA